MKILCFALAGALQASCPGPTPSPVTSDDAGPGPTILDAARQDAGDVYTRACAALKSAGCAEGALVHCADVLWLADEKHLVNFHPACLAAARTAAEIRACGKEIPCRE